MSERVLRAASTWAPPAWLWVVCLTCRARFFRVSPCEGADEARCLECQR